MKFIFNFLSFIILGGSLSLVNAQANNDIVPGKLIEMGGYKLHALVEGNQADGPTIVFFHGAGDIALIWNLVLPKVGSFATALAIDQNGEGWSEHGHGMALNQQVYDSYQVLKKGGFPAPYILVGHSLGGIIAQLFAVEYSDEIKAVVLVDATHPDVVLKIYNPEKKKLEWKKMRLTADQSIPLIIKDSINKPKEISSFQPRRDFGEMLKKFSERDQNYFHWIYNERPWTYVKGQTNTYEAEIFQEMYTHKEKYNLGDIPLVVITGGDKEPKQGDENWTAEQLQKHSEFLQKDLLNLSTQSERIIARKSGHHIHIDEPEIIIEVLKKLVNNK